MNHESVRRLRRFCDVPWHEFWHSYQASLLCRSPPPLQTQKVARNFARSPVPRHLRHLRLHQTRTPLHRFPRPCDACPWCVVSCHENMSTVNRSASEQNTLCMTVSLRNRCFPLHGSLALSLWLILYKHESRSFWARRYFLPW